MEGRVLMASGLTQFTIPLAPDTQIEQFTKGADGNFWFEEETSGINSLRTTAFGKITPAGQVTVVPAPSDVGLVESLIPLADGTLWFTSIIQTASVTLAHEDFIGRITPNGQVSLFDVPEKVFDGSSPLVPGEDGNLWFLEGNENWLLAPPPGGTGSQIQVARITPQGNIQDVSALSAIPGNALSTTIEPNPDALYAVDGGVLWFGESGSNTGALVRIDTKTGQAQAYTIPSGAGTSQTPAGIAITTDDSVWFVIDEASRNGTERFQLDRVTSGGGIVNVTLPGRGHASSGKPQLGGYLTPDTAGNAWFLEYSPTSATYLARVNSSGDDLRTKARVPRGGEVFPGQDGSIFFVAGTQTLGHATSSGKVSYIHIKAAHPKALSIVDSLLVDSLFKDPVIDSNGDLWFIDSTSGRIERYQFPTAKHGASHLASMAHRR